MPQRDGYENSVAYVESICLVFTICVALLRLWTRRSAYGRDDAVVAVATLISLGQTAASYASLTYGLGKTWNGIRSEGNLEQLEQASMASIILFFIALYLSKCAMLAFLSRITKTSSEVMLYHICSGIVGAIGLLSIIAVTADCTASSGYYWAFALNTTTCPSQSVRWQSITGLDIFTEIVLLLLPLELLWKLQMPRSKKIMLVVAFWIRLPTLAFSLARNYYTIRLQHATSDSGLDSAFVVIWMEIELAFAIGANTLSALKSFTESANTGFGLGFTRGKGDDSYGLSNVSGSSDREKGKTATSSSQSRSRSNDDGRSWVSPDGIEKGSAQFRTHPALRAMGRGTGIPPLRLRPEQTSFASYTNVTAGPAGDMSPWRLHSSGGSESSGAADDMIIVQQREVVLDSTPILDHAIGSAR